MMNLLKSQRNHLDKIIYMLIVQKKKIYSWDLEHYQSGTKWTTWLVWADSAHNELSYLMSLLTKPAGRPGTGYQPFT